MYSPCIKQQKCNHLTTIAISCNRCMHLEVGPSKLFLLHRQTAYTCSTIPLNICSDGFYHDFFFPVKTFLQIEEKCCTQIVSNSRTLFQSFVPIWLARGLKGTVSRDFLLLVFFMNQFPPSPRVSYKDRFKFFWKFASQGAPPMSTIPVAIAAGINDTGGKFATGFNDTGCKFWHQFR